jgi:nucleotide-binding universal stress UspA family protein
MVKPIASPQEVEMAPTLICYDGSPSAQHALALAYRSLDARPKVLLTVWSTPERVHADSFGFDQHGDDQFYARLCELVERAASQTAEHGQQLAAELGLDVEARVERNHSTVSQTILTVADELDSDMILVGTHGTTAVQPGLLGSVSNGLLHQSRRPVLVVPILDPIADTALSELGAASGGR